MRRDRATVVELPPPGALSSPDPDDPLAYYYRALTGWAYRARLRLAGRLLGVGPFGSLLEVGYGSGIFLPELARRSERLVGVDVHGAGGSVAAALARLGVDARLDAGSILQLPYREAEFDAVVCLSVLEHLDDPPSALAELRRVLRPGGIAVLGFPVRNPATDAFFRLAGHRPREIHPSSHRDILRAARAEPGFVVEEVRRWPRRAPLDVAAYVGCRCRAYTGASGA